MYYTTIKQGQQIRIGPYGMSAVIRGKKIRVAIDDPTGSAVKAQDEREEEAEKDEAEHEC